MLTYVSVSGQKANHQLTPKTTHTSRTSNDSISQPSEKNNPSDKKNSKISVEDGRASVTANGTYSYNELVATGNLTGVGIDKSQQVKIKTTRSTRGFDLVPVVGV